jgi:hypothetical protein
VGGILMTRRSSTNCSVNHSILLLVHEPVVTTRTAATAKATAMMTSRTMTVGPQRMLAFRQRRDAAYALTRFAERNLTYLLLASAHYAIRSPAHDENERKERKRIHDVLTSLLLANRSLATGRK